MDVALCSPFPAYAFSSKPVLVTHAAAHKLKKAELIMSICPKGIRHTGGSMIMSGRVSQSASSDLQTNGSRRAQFDPAPRTRMDAMASAFTSSQIGMEGPTVASSN